MKGMAGEIFIVTEDWETVRARHTEGPERAEEKAVTAGATKATILKRREDEWGEEDQERVKRMVEERMEGRVRRKLCSAIYRVK